MATREDRFKYVKDEYGTEPDYTWDNFPDYAILRHGSEGDQKWYGLVMDVGPDKLDLDENTEKDAIDVLNVKVEEELIGGLIDNKVVVPAYHMSGEHWVSIVLKNVSSKKKVYEMIDDSFDLTK